MLSLKSFFSNFYHKLKFLPNTISVMYEQNVSIFLMRYAYFPYLLLEKFFIKKNFYFLTNLSEGVGHACMELHMFDNQFRNDDLPIRKNCNFILVYKKSEIVDTIFSLYKSDLSYIKYIKNNFLFHLLLPMFIKNNSDLILDIGLGKHTYEINRLDHTNRVTNNIIFSGIGIRSSNEIENRLNNVIYKHRSKKFYRSFLNNIFLTSQDRTQFEKIGIENKKTLLIHLNERVTNACAKLLEPQVYLKLIEYAKGKDYQIVLMGREKYPEIFKRYQVINYAESKIANFLNDLKLFKFAEFSVINASGLAAIPRYLDKYYLYINYWHINTRVESDKSIMLPTLISRKDNFLNTIQDQIKLQKSNINTQNLREINMETPNDLDILNAFKELENLKIGNYEHTKEQIILKDKLRNTQSKISKFFIKNKAINP